MATAMISLSFWGALSMVFWLSSASSIFAFLLDFRGLSEFKSRLLSANERGFLKVNTFFEFLRQRRGKSRDWKARFW
jgi:hypothetical protein